MKEFDLEEALLIFRCLQTGKINGKLNISIARNWAKQSWSILPTDKVTKVLKTNFRV
jgi:hypothetical protein